MRQLCTGQIFLLSGAALTLVTTFFAPSAKAVSLQVHGDGGVVGDFASDLPPYRTHYQGYRVPLGLSLEARASNTVSLIGDLRLNFNNYPNRANALGNTTDVERNGDVQGRKVNHPLLGNNTQKMETPMAGTAYFQWASEIGLIRAGRMPHNWGLGLWRSSDWKLTGGAVTTSDALSMTADFTPTFSVTVYWEKISEGSPFAKDDDADAYTAEALLSDDPSDVSSHGINRQLGLSFQRYDHRQSSTKILVMDLFTRIYYGPWGAEGEIYFPSGSTESSRFSEQGGNGICLQQKKANGTFIDPVTEANLLKETTCNSQRVENFATLWRFRYQLGGNVKPTTEKGLSLAGTDMARMRLLPTTLRNETHVFALTYGYARGDKDAFANVGSKDDRVRLTSMHPNIRPGLLMFSDVAPRVPGMPGSLVENATFVKWEYAYETPSFGMISPSILYGRLNETNSKGSNADGMAFGRDASLGVEADIAYRYLTTDNVDLGLEAGFWFPGAAWKTTATGKPDNAFGLRVMAGTHF